VRYKEGHTWAGRFGRFLAGLCELRSLKYREITIQIFKGDDAITVTPHLGVLTKGVLSHSDIYTLWDEISGFLYIL
jgi:hypothetical protein